MATTSVQDRAFISDIISSSLLEDAIEWIMKHLSPDDVFSTQDLADWAERNGYEQI